MNSSQTRATADQVWKQARRNYRSGRLDEAHSAVARYLSLQPECGRGWELLGLIQHAWQQWEPACQALEEASVRVPLIPQAECALANCYLAAGKHDWAYAQYCQLIERPDATVRVLLDVATGLNALGDSRLAVVACRKAIQIDPNDSQPYFDLSFSLGRCGASASTIEASARRAISLAPENYSYRIGLAGFLLTQQRPQEAYQLLEKLTLKQIRSIVCHCCLIRLLRIFEAAGDTLRSEWCQRRRDELWMHQDGNSCEGGTP